MRRFRHRTTLWIILASLVLFISLIQGFDKTNPDKPCLDCHSPKIEGASPLLLDEKYIHAPIQENNCEACHGASGQEPISHESQCYQCHDVRKFKGKSFRHPGPESGNYCLLCHEPHSSDFEFLLKGDPIPFCQSCHVNTKKYRSHPVGRDLTDPLKNSSMTCTSTCHNLHRSDFPELTPWKDRELCIKCHEDIVR